MILKKRILSVLLSFILLAFFQTSAFAKDDWTMVNSKNFKLIGNASDKDIRKVATKLEQFREVFVKLFTEAKFQAKVPTNVIVFKNASSYKPFKPKRANGKIDEFIAGYFQSGEDVNYITLSTEGDEADTYGTIFHEFVHALMDINFGKSDIPPWFNEGLAEFYQTFKIEDDQKVTLGYPQGDHLNLLQQSQFIPLDTLFNIDNYSLHQNGNHSKSVFYAESWALIHFLVQGNKVSQNDKLGKFLMATLQNVPAEKAFQDAFQMSYKEMEKVLRKYVQQGTFLTRVITFKDKLVFENEMQSFPLSEAMVNAYLGDLLFHTNRLEDAEPYLQKSISIEPDLSFANNSMGMVKLRQHKYSEAKTYLEKAISDDNKNYLAHYRYAYLLSREGMSESGYVSQFTTDSAAKMRASLKKAISINPDFAESYDLLAFISLVNNEQMDEAIQYLRKAISLQPGNQQYSIRIAEIYSRQDKLKESKELAEKIAKTTDELQIKDRAESLLNRIRQIEEINAQNETNRKQFEDSIKNNNQPMLTRVNQQTERTLTPEEAAKLQEEETMISLNQALRKPETGEKQAIGYITKIACVGGKITYTVKTEKAVISLFSKDFQNLALVSLVDSSENTEVGCNANIAGINTVVTFKEPVKANTNGELVAIDFVPKNFRFVDVTKSQAVTGIYGNRPSSTENENSGDPNNSIMQAMKRALRKPKEGEKQEQGFIEKIECDNQGMTLFFKTETQSLRLVNTSSNLQIIAYTPDIQQVKFGCGLKQVDIPVVFIYRPNLDSKAKNNGEILSLEFMPKAFKLNN